MSNIELIDDYLTNKLSDSQRELFEQQMASDPSLKSDVEFQRQIIESVKSARAAELKSMLNNIPVSPFKGFTTLKIAAGVVTGALFVSAIYWFGNSDQEKPVIAEPIDSISVVTEDPSPAAEDEAKTTNTPAKEEKPAVADTKATEITKKDVIKPALDVVDPSSELVESTSSPVSQGVAIPSSPAIEIKSVEVDVDSTHKKYKFHYQFAEGKVLLYGSFDRSLYEIIELNGGNHSVYLYYQTKYYFLNEKATSITSLEPVTDKSTLIKLETYRKK
jgi:hypothetical protein